MNDYEKELVKWLKPNHPDILEEIQQLKQNSKKYPNHWDLVDIMDDQYPDVYNYFCEYC